MEFCLFWTSYIVCIDIIYFIFLLFLDIKYDEKNLFPNKRTSLQFISQIKWIY